MAMFYKKKFETFSQMKKAAIDMDEYEDEGELTSKIKKYEFRHSHPGYRFCHLARLKLPVILKASLPIEKLCPLEDLDLGSDSPSENAIEKRKDYAKMALLVFHPF